MNFMHCLELWLIYGKGDCSYNCCMGGRSKIRLCLQVSALLQDKFEIFGTLKLPSTQTAYAICMELICYAAIILLALPRPSFP